MQIKKPNKTTRRLVSVLQSPSAQANWSVIPQLIHIIPSLMRADDGASSGAGKKPPVVGSDSSSSGGSDSEEDDKHARAPPDANTPCVPGNKKADLKRLFCFTLSVRC